MDPPRRREKPRLELAPARPRLGVGIEEVFQRNIGRIDDLRIEKKRANCQNEKGGSIKDREELPNINALNANLRENHPRKRGKPRLELASARPRLGVGSRKAVERNIGRMDDLQTEKKRADRLQLATSFASEDQQREICGERSIIMNRQMVGDGVAEMNDDDDMEAPGASNIIAGYTNHIAIVGSQPVHIAVGPGASQGGRIDDKVDNLHPLEYDEISMEEEVMTADVERASIKTDDKAKAKGQDKVVIVVALALITIIVIGLGIGLSQSGRTNSNDSEALITQNKEDCNFAEGTQLSIAWNSCLCNNNTADISEGHISKYNSLKDIFIEKSILSADFDNHTNLCEVRNLALLWLAEDTIDNNKDLEEQSLINRFVLALFFLSLTNNNPDQWQDKTGWLSSDTECDWFGITCDETGDELWDINLIGKLLIGTIPKEISLLTELTGLRLSKNAISGTIPTELGLLTNLELLFLDSNRKLEGTIPTELGQLKVLRKTWLSNTQLVGSIPSEIGNLTTLVDLQLSLNAFSGSIPSEIGKLSALEVLHLARNMLSGSIPSEIGNLDSLKDFRGWSNQFVGAIPSEIGHLKSLEYATLYQNKLTGSIPSFIGLCTSLLRLELQYNRFVGTIPSEIGHLKSLEYATLYQNKFTGPIPSSIGLCTSLSFLDLGSNQLVSTIPSEIGFLQELSSLRFSENKFSGSIPTHLSDCQSLKKLFFGRNQRIEGTMPSELGKLSSLELLTSCNTDMTGSMPSEICDLKNGNLTYLGSSLRECNCCDSCLY